MGAVVKQGAPWSPADVEQLELMMSKQTALAEIAVQLGRTEKAVEAKVNGLQRLRNGSKAGKRLQRRSSGASFFLS
jgi:hypothetical protein